MKLWKVYSKSQYFYKLSFEIGEAHIAGRETFGPGVSFSVREATLDEWTEWITSPGQDTLFMTIDASVE